MSYKIVDQIQVAGEKIMIKQEVTDYQNDIKLENLQTNIERSPENENEAQNSTFDLPVLRHLDKNQNLQTVGYLNCNAYSDTSCKNDADKSLMCHSYIKCESQNELDVFGNMSCKRDLIVKREPSVNMAECGFRPDLDSGIEHRVNFAEDKDSNECNLGMEIEKDNKVSKVYTVAVKEDDEPFLICRQEVVIKHENTITDKHVVRADNLEKWNVENEKTKLFVTPSINSLPESSVMYNSMKTDMSKDTEHDFENLGQSGDQDVKVENLLDVSYSQVQEDESAETEDVENPFKQKPIAKTSKLQRKKHYICEFCNKDFLRWSGLQNHKLIHTGETPYTCHFCKKGFNVRSNLNAHLRIHSGVKPHVCEHCNKSFRQAGQLKHHMRVHNGEKPYNCNYCTRTFRSSSSLVTHLRTHTGEKPFHCKLCSRSFSTSTSLKTHHVTHSGQMLYDCPQCDKKFNRKNNLNVHIKRHEKHRNFICHICSNGFVMRAHLLNHLRLTHLMVVCTDSKVSDSMDNIIKEEPPSNENDSGTSAGK